MLESLTDLIIEVKLKLNRTLNDKNMFMNLYFD